LNHLLKGLRKMKQSFLFSVLLTLVNTIYSQQETSTINDLNPDYYEVTLLNRKLLNPSDFNDTSLFNFDLIKNSYAFVENSTIISTSISAESTIKKLRSSFGLVANLSKYNDETLNRQSYEIFYKYLLLKNDNLKINTGIGIGFLQYIAKYQIIDFDNDLSNATNRNNSFTCNIGLNTEFKNHGIGIALNNYLITTEFVYINGDIAHDALLNLTANYFYRLRLNSNLFIVPEFIFINSKTENVYLFNTLLSISNKLNTGLYFDSKKNVGAVVNVRFLKYFEVGYSYIFNNFQINSGLNKLKIGFIIPG